MIWNKKSDNVLELYLKIEKDFMIQSIIKDRVVRVLFIALFTFFSGSTFAQSGELKLVENGTSKYSLALFPKTDSNVQKAVALLQSYIKKIAGCSLPMATGKTQQGIFIKINPNIKNPDGYTITNMGENLVISGGKGKGCIYAVVELLEKYMGCHYYTPTCKVIPTRKDITIPTLKITDEPFNDYRIVNISDKVDDEFLYWNRLNTIDEYYARGYYVHTFNKLVPWPEYFKTHPEYFAFMNGKRIIDQLCLSNPEVLKLVISRLEAEMKLQPDKLYWSLSQNDNFSYCHCDKCQKIVDEEKSPAGPVIRFVNKVAEKFPDKIISTLAYQFSRPAPVVTKPLDNVQVMLCTIELNRSKPIVEDEGSKSFVKDIVDWGKICKRIYLWDYTIDFAHSVSPFPNLHVLQPNIQFFCENNVRAHFQQSNISIGQEFSELKLYLISRLLWNPNANKDEIINEFLAGYYGESAKWIRKYIDRMQEEVIKSGTGLDIYGHPVSHKDDFLSEKNMEEYNSYFNMAFAAHNADSAYLLPLRIALLPLQYAEMEIGKNDMFGKRGWYTENGDDFKLKPAMKQMLESFYATCKEANITHLNENGLTPKEYYESTLRFIDIQVKGNYAFRKKVKADPMPSPKYSNGYLDMLSNGVRGANDYKVHWLGWEGQNFSLVMDLEKSVNANTIEISTLWDAKSWILHPAAIVCYVSQDGKGFTRVGEIKKEGNQQKENLTEVWKFTAPKTGFRYVKFEIKGTLNLFDWHPSAGGASWVFVDEIVVK